MKIYNSFDEIEYNQNTIVTVGTFDGVHRGHQMILKKLITDSQRYNWRGIVLTIHPHPQILLRKENKEPIRLLTAIEERTSLFESLGIGHLMIIPFTLEFSQTSPEHFIRELIAGKIGLKKMLVGYDHLFGKDRKGNLDLLEELGTELSFEIERINPHLENDIIVSSTKTRNAIINGNISLANKMLGYDYFLIGKVVKGDGRGAALGYPTANLEPSDKNKLLPSDGVYFISSVIDGKRYYGMANIGTRPTFTNKAERVVEAFYFNFSRDIYNKQIILEFHKYLRPEYKFPDKNELISQMKQDEADCIELINSKFNSFHNISLL